MVTIRDANTIILNLVNFFKAAQPNLDTKTGTVARDLFIDSQASQLALLYDELSKISNLQSLRLVAGSDLDKLAQNVGATRKSATPSTGVALLTFVSIPAVISIPQGGIITASNGLTFSVTNGLSVDPANSNYYKSIATQYQSALAFLNITDLYAVEVTVTANVSGSNGNISQYALTSTTIAGVSNVTNPQPFTGGTDQETDATFRNRVLAIFSGSNIGTALGYKNLALSNNSVSDAIVIGPGNPLMTRDGTQVVQNADGTYTIITPGTGGKVDVLILGDVLQQHTDTFIYVDKSNTNDATNSANDFILGQLASDAGLTIPQKRVADIAAGAVPAQPVQEILQVTGSRSGSNFQAYSIDENGVVSGNYQLIKDTGPYAGSPWAVDTLHWVSNEISITEDKVKSKFNGQDNTTFSDVLEIPTVQQNIPITNENSIVSSSDNSLIQLIHSPATNVTRVFNTNTGETYTIVNQNVGGTGSTNTSGIIQISGNTLPSPSTILQVDYTWIVSYDAFSDYDGKILKNNPRPNTDSVDWGMSNTIRNERVLFTLNSQSNIYSGSTSLPITSVVSANTFSASTGQVAVTTLPTYFGRLSITLAQIVAPITSIESIRIANSDNEIYNTAMSDGTFINTTIVVGTILMYTTTIILPTDTSATAGQYGTITYNQNNVFSVSNSAGSFSANQLTIPASNLTISPLPSQVYMDVTYIAAVQDLMSAGITSFPVARAANGFQLNSTVGQISGVKSNTMRRENQTINENNSSQFYITLNLSSNDYLLSAAQIISVIDIRTDLEIWNADNPGTVTINANNNYQLTFSGYNTPATGDNVLVVYFATDVSRVQPFTYANNIVCRDLQTLQFNFASNNFYTDIHSFVVESSLHFSVIDTITGLSLVNGTDGYIVSSSGATAVFGSVLTNFSSIADITGKKIQIHNPANINNSGTFSILNYSSHTNDLTIGVITQDLTADQISVVRIADGAELWNSATGNISSATNIINLPEGILATQGDKVITFVYTNKNLHQAPTRVAITTTDQTNNSGVVSVMGTILTRAASIQFNAINNGLKQNVLAAIKTALGLSSTAQVSNVYLSRIVQLQKVVTSGGEVTNVEATYDVFGTQLANNTFYTNEMFVNETLEDTELVLPSTTNNINNAPKIGDTLLITFYYAIDGYVENVSFTKNGTQYTNNKFTNIDTAYISSGFANTQSARFVFSYFTQPATGSRYNATYNYTAPKQNERILINYNYNSLISDVTFTIEQSRPITADVLVKAAQEILVDATVNIVVSSTATNSATLVIQNVKNAIISAINANQLGTVVSQSNIISVGQAVTGVERIRVIYFNETGKNGSVLTVEAQSNQYLVANNIIVNPESL